MTRIGLAAATFGAALLLSSCAKDGAAPAGAPHAIVTMRDGTSVGGTVVSSSPTEIRLNGDDNVARTIPMTQVRAIDYGDTAPASSAAMVVRPPINILAGISIHIAK